MTSWITEIGIDCHQPEALADFWCAALGFAVIERTAEFVSIGSPALRGEGGLMRSAGEGSGTPILTFARVPEGKGVKNRLHLDLTPHGVSQEEEVRRLIILGARPIDIGQGIQEWVVMADPEGNEFCVLSDR
ncbi:VOC family protein [Glutamicibacter creatinolyticus]|uniref:VOC family protein n=1 Tax=Micrococcaceae TaxID=1268 RepID=UPI0006D03470|nr:VOC family protein [Arthrobacter sp. JCM 19049]